MNYQDYARISKQYNEANDCAVIAVAVVLGTSYEDAHALLKEFGRKDRRGTHFDETTKPALESRGFKVERRFLRNPAFNKKWSIKSFQESSLFQKFKHPLLVLVSKHILAVKNGVVEDFTSGRRHRILSIWEIIPTEDSVYSLPVNIIPSIAKPKTREYTYALIHQKTQEVYKKYKRFPTSIHRRATTDPMGLWIRGQKTHTQGQLAVIKL